MRENNNIILRTRLEDLSVYEIYAPFDKALFSLKNSEIEPISSRDLAYARMKDDTEKLIYRSGYTKEGFLTSRKFYISKEQVLITLNSPLLMPDLAKKAVESNEKDRYLITDKFVYDAYREIAEKDKNKKPEEKNVLILSKKKSYSIPTNRFNEEEMTLFLFKDLAEDYGNFLKEIDNINEIAVWTIEKSFYKGTILTQLYNGAGGINGSLDSLQYSNVFGSVRNKFE